MLDPPLEFEELKVLTDGKLPKEYLSFLEEFNGIEAEIPIMPYNLFLDSVQDVIKSVKGLSYEVPPELILIGSSGGAELIVFDTRKEPFWVSSLPCIGQDYENLYLLAKSFQDLLALFGKRPGDYSFDDELGREIILSNALIARDASVWNETQVRKVVEEFNLNKHAPGFRPYAGVKNDDHSFLAINESDGAIYEVSCFGLNYLPPNKLANSKEQLEEYLSMTSSHPPDEWRLYGTDSDAKE